MKPKPTPTAGTLIGAVAQPPPKQPLAGKVNPLLAELRQNLAGSQWRDGQWRLAAVSTKPITDRQPGWIYTTRKVMDPVTDPECKANGLHMEPQAFKLFVRFTGLETTNKTTTQETEVTP